ncbi:MAG: tetratricopeptide repeat protein [Treponema sp.]|nr:tetratricopeptide repeat protein [Treponema sp.]
MKAFGVPLLLLFFACGLYAQRTDALAEYRSGNYEEAVQICKQELKINPGNLESHVVICWSLLSLRRYEECRLYAIAGRTISRYDPRIIETLGEAYYFQGRNSEALQYFQEYINLAPQGSRIDIVYYYTGEIFIRLGQYRRADIALSTAVYYVPQNAEWWTRLAYARENAGEDAASLTAYERALSINTNLIDAQRGRSRIRSALAN